MLGVGGVMTDNNRVDWTDYLRQVEFNDSIDSEGTVEIATCKFERSRILYVMDPDAYREAADVFESERIAGLMTLARKCLDNGGRHNFARFEELVEISRKSQMIPFIGAGLTKSSGMPDWRTFLLDCAEDTALSRAEVEELIDNDRYEEAAHKVYEAAGEDVFTTCVRDVFGREVRPVGAVCLLPRIVRTCVITTNFDRVIETLFEVQGRKLDRVIGPEADEFHEAVIRGGAYILKIHGDAITPRSRVLSRSQYDAAYGGAGIDLKLPLPKALAQVFQSRVLLFLGCSLHSDRTLTLFKILKEREGARVNHFALVEHPGDARKKAERERFLQSHSIKPIWYPTKEYQCIEGLLLLLAQGMETP